MIDLPSCAKVMRFAVLRVFDNCTTRIHPHKTWVFPRRNCRPEPHGVDKIPAKAGTSSAASKRARKARQFVHGILFSFVIDTTNPMALYLACSLTRNTRPEFGCVTGCEASECQLTWPLTLFRLLSPRRCRCLSHLSVLVLSTRMRKYSCILWKSSATPTSCVTSQANT